MFGSPSFTFLHLAMSLTPHWLIDLQTETFLNGFSRDTSRLDLINATIDVQTDGGLFITNLNMVSTTPQPDSVLCFFTIESTLVLFA
jgi:hypothetical protein